MEPCAGHVPDRDHPVPGGVLFSPGFLCGRERGRRGKGVEWKREGGKEKDGKDDGEDDEKDKEKKRFFTIF